MTRDKIAIAAVKMKPHMTMELAVFFKSGSERAPHDKESERVLFVMRGS
jgi:hypothetical protein